MISIFMFISIISYIIWICSGLNGAILNAVFFLILIIAYNTNRGENDKR